MLKSADAKIIEFAEQMQESANSPQRIFHKINNISLTKQFLPVERRTERYNSSCKLKISRCVYVGQPTNNERTNETEKKAKTTNVYKPEYRKTDPTYATIT